MKCFQINILDLISQVGEDVCKDILSSFYCPLNKDIENFIKEKAISFAKQQIAITYLVFKKESYDLTFVGYYTLTNKSIFINKDALSNSIARKILKFGQHDQNSSRFMLPMPLIAQLGKNFSLPPNVKISGSELLRMALAKVAEIQYSLGGKTTYIECSNEKKLADFYSSNGFFLLEEQEPASTSNLKKMIKILNPKDYEK